jgi:hypothetical protein
MVLGLWLYCQRDKTAAAVWCLVSEPVCGFFTLHSVQVMPDASLNAYETLLGQPYGMPVKWNFLYVCGCVATGW